VALIPAFNEDPDRDVTPGCKTRGYNNLYSTELNAPMNNPLWLNQANHSPRGNIIMNFWNQLTKVILVNAGLQPAHKERNSITDAFLHQASQNASSKTEPVLITCEEASVLSSGSYKAKFSYRTFESAFLVLTLTRKQDARLQDNPSIQAFYEHLEKAMHFDFSARSYAGKTVVTVEGLEGSGKSTMLGHIAMHCQNVQIISPRSIPTVGPVLSTFMTLPEPICRAFLCAVNYIIAYEIVHSPYSAFLVENYHHAVCARAVATAVSSTEDISALVGSVFEWPFDLPQPELVILCIIQNVALHFVNRSRLPVGVVPLGAYGHQTESQASPRCRPLNGDRQRYAR
jgi:hypothetical protein